MIEACKFCNNKIPIPELGDDWWCYKCRQYSIACMENGIVESETLRSGNFYLHYFPIYNTASIVSTRDDDKHILKSFEMNQFTHEDAIYWANKLKTYVVFQ